MSFLSHRLFAAPLATRRPTVGPRLGDFACRPLEDRLVPTFGLTGQLSPIAAGAEPIAAVESGPRLLAVDTADSALLNGLLCTLAGPGTNLSLSAVDYDALSHGAVNLGTLLGRLQAQVGVGSPDSALAADATLGQLLTAAADAAQADGATVLASLFGVTAAALPSTGTFRLNELLDVSLPPGSFAQAEVNALDLLVGGVQLINYQNTAATSAPVMLSTPALGPLGTAVQAVTLQARVVEPPVYVVGPAGSRFHSAAVRLKLDVDLADISLDTSALTAPIRAALGDAVAVTAAATVGRLSLFADVARGSGSIQAVDALTNAVTLRSTPAVADVYLGAVADGVFFDRVRPVDPATDLTPGVVGRLAVSASLLDVSVLDLNLELTARSAAEGAAATPYVTTYLPAFPKADTVGSSAAVIGDLVATLVQNLRIEASGGLGVLASQGSLINAVLSGAAVTQLRPTLHNLLGGLLDPALGSLGVGLGQMDLIVLGADSPDIPVAADDTATTVGGQPVTVAVLSNDAIQAGTSPTLSLSVAPAHGTATVNADGSITYTPAASYLGADTFQYTLTDAYGRTSTATVQVQVNRGANTGPVAGDDRADTTTGTTVTVAVLANDSDADGDPLTVTITTPPAHGTAVVNADGSITYTPASAYLGVDTFTYTVADGFGGSDTASVSVQVVRGPNRTPMAQPDTVTTTAATAVTIDVLSNDTDADGDTLSISSITQPAHGAVVIQADGRLTYTPTTAYVGTDVFAYVVVDGFGGSSTASVSVTVGRGANRNPVATPDTASTPVRMAATVAVLANDTDDDGDPLTVTAVTLPAHGTAVANADGTITYTPAAGFRGVDTFAYTAADGFGGSASATVNVVVGNAAGNSDPVARPDTLVTTVGVAATVDVRANDSDADGDLLSVQLAAPPAHGSVVVNADGTLTYTPLSGYVGADTFAYLTIDGYGGSATAEVTVTVARGPNHTPVASADTAATAVRIPVTVNVLANDGDGDGDLLTVSAVSAAEWGSVVLNSDGTITYTPARGFRGTETFTYTVTDGVGGSATGTVTVVVSGNTPPVVNPDRPFIPTGTAVTVNVLANDSDADGDPLTVTAVTTPARGSVVVNPDGTITYTPAAGFRGVDTFSYTVSDSHTGTGIAAVTVTVGSTSGNTSPVPRADVAATLVDTAITVDVLANDTDADGDRLVVTSVTMPSHGTALVKADGLILYTPADGYVGSDKLTYTVADGFGGTAIGAVTVTVEPASTVTPAIPPVTPPNRPQQGDLSRRPFAVGADTTGGPRVTVFNSDGTQLHNFFAYDPTGRFGVAVAMGDVTGDGVMDLVTGPGVGGGPHVRVFDGVNLAEIHNYFAFESDFRGGVWVAAGDYDGDGRADVIVGAGTGGGPRVRVFDGRDGIVLADFYAFDPADRGGALVAAADFDGDGLTDIMASNGAGSEARVRVFAAIDGRTLSDLQPFEDGYTGGANVAAADITNDDRLELVVGAGMGGGPRVRVIDWPNGLILEDKFVYEESFTGGVRVAAADLDGDGRAEVLTGAGIGGGPRQQLRHIHSTSPTVDRFVFEEEFRGGILVG